MEGDSQAETGGQHAYRQAYQSTVNFIMEQIAVLTKRLQGKAKTVRFSPTMLQFAMSIYARSRKGYTEVSELLHLPSISTLQKLKQASGVHSGMCSSIYRNARVRNGNRGGSGLLLCDEMKIQAGMVFCTSNNMVTGFVDDALCMDALCKQLFSGDAQTTTTSSSSSSSRSRSSDGGAGEKLDEDCVENVNNLAQYVNQWLWRSNVKSEGDAHLTVQCEYFFSKQPASGAELTAQFHRVLRLLELAEFEVHALCSDAGGGNSSMFRYLRETTAGSIDIHWLPDSYVSLAHPMFEQRRIWLFHCSTHGKIYSYKKIVLDKLLLL